MTRAIQRFVRMGWSFLVTPAQLRASIVEVFTTGSRHSRALVIGIAVMRE